MSDYVTKTELKAAMREQTDEIAGLLQTFMGHVDDRFNGVETRLDGVETRLGGVESRLEKVEFQMVHVVDRLDKVEQRLDDLDAKYGHLLATIDSFIARIDKYETELLIRDGQFERLLAWARKVSEKTGVPLENL